MPPVSPSVDTTGSNGWWTNLSSFVTGVAPAVGNVLSAVNQGRTGSPQLPPTPPAAASPNTKLYLIGGVLAFVLLIGGFLLMRGKHN